MTFNVFSSVTMFQRTFSKGLSRLLAGNTLGGFFLALANVKCAPNLVGSLGEDIENSFQRLQGKYRETLLKGRPITDSDDDALVFFKIACVGLEQIGTTEHRKTGKWQIQFNLVRSFRPKRQAQKPVKVIRAPFAEEKFHFDKPSLQKECFWQGHHMGTDIRLFYNKFPFTDFHSLLVPDPAKKRAQFLSRKYHNFIWSFTSAIGSQLPGVGFGYYSYGACASVNQLHFQMFISNDPLPVLGKAWQHNGGTAEYPACCKKFESAEESWNYIDSLHKRRIAYNLLYVPQRIYCFPRRNQGTYQQSPWTSGFAWYEMSGGVITFNREDFTGLRKDTVTRELKAVTLNVET